jgi:hypothetical protein
LALAALIAAYHDSKEAGYLRATLPLGGRTLLERQARLAFAAGARRLVVLVERLPTELIGAMDRLRREGIQLVVARNANEAAEAVDAADRLLIIGDGFLGEEQQLTRLAGAGKPAVLTVPDAGFDDRFERIDAASRWAGAAVTSGAALRDTAAMLRDWDLQSTLLRRLVQTGADLLPLGADAGDVTIIDKAADLREIQRRALDRPASGRGAWISRYLLGPVERAATRSLMGYAVTPAALGGVAMVLSAFGAAAFAADFLWLGLALLLLSTPLDGIADRLARLRMDDGVGHSWWSHILPALAGAALVALGYSLAEENGWGCVILALNAVAFLLAERFEVEGKDVPGMLFLAERRNMIWLILPFAAFGYWAYGLAALFVYAAASFFWAQRQVHRTRQD